MEKLKPVFADRHMLGRIDIYDLKDGEKIFHPEADQFEIAYHLQGLTGRTEQKYGVHDFARASVGRRVINDAPLLGETKGLREMEVLSTVRAIKDGDVIIAREGGKISLRMAFDVEFDGDRYNIRTAPHLPHLNIGHAYKPE